MKGNDINAKLGMYLYNQGTITYEQFVETLDIDELTPRPMKTLCTCKDHGEIKEGIALVECAICKGLKPIDRIVTMNINGGIRIYNSQEEYEAHLVKDMQEIFDNSFTNDPAIMDKYKTKDD